MDKGIIKKTVKRVNEENNLRRSKRLKSSCGSLSHEMHSNLEASRRTVKRVNEENNLRRSKRLKSSCGSFSHEMHPNLEVSKTIIKRMKKKSNQSDNKKPKSLFGPFSHEMHPNLELMKLEAETAALYQDNTKLINERFKLIQEASRRRKLKEPAPSIVIKPSDLLRPPSPSKEMIESIGAYALKSIMEITKRMNIRDESTSDESNPMNDWRYGFTNVNHDKKNTDETSKKIIEDPETDKEEEEINELRMSPSYFLNPIGSEKNVETIQLSSTACEDKEK